MLNSADGGYKSRKLHLTYITQIFICLGAILAGKLPVFAPMYSTFVGGILGAAALYITGNVANSVVSKKAVVEPAAEPEEAKND